jgi:hypothetical protein
MMRSIRRFKIDSRAPSARGGREACGAGSRIGIDALGLPLYSSTFYTGKAHALAARRASRIAEK